MAAFTKVDKIFTFSNKDAYGYKNSLLVPEDEEGFAFLVKSQRINGTFSDKNNLSNPFDLEDINKLAHQSQTSRRLTETQKKELKYLINSPPQNKQDVTSVADASNQKIQDNRSYRLGSIRKDKNQASILQPNIQEDLEANNVVNDEEELLKLMAEKDRELIKKDLKSMGYTTVLINEVLNQSDKLLTVAEAVELLEKKNETNRQSNGVLQASKKSLLGVQQSSPKVAPIVASAAEIDLSSKVEAEEKPNVDLKMCDSCYEEQPLSEFFNLDCQHQFCKGCFLEHLETYIKDGKVVKIPCMMHKCEQVFDDKSIEEFGSKDLSEKYVRFQDNMKVDQDPNLKWCPSPDCKKYVRKNEKSHRVICECNADICFLCGNFWHEGKSCEDAGDKEMAEWLKNAKDIQDCPMCGAKTLRMSGCNRIQCHACKKYWCWLCRGQNIEYSHYEQKDAHFADNFLGSKEETCRGSVLRGKRQKPITNIPLMILILIFLPAIVILKSFGEVMFFTWYIKYRECGDRVIPGTLAFLLILPFALIFWYIYVFIAIICLPCFYVEQCKRISAKCKGKKQDKK